MSNLLIDPETQCFHLARTICNTKPIDSIFPNFHDICQLLWVTSTNGVNFSSCTATFVLTKVLSFVDYQILCCVGQVIRRLVFDPKVPSLTIAVKMRTELFLGRTYSVCTSHCAFLAISSSVLFSSSGIRSPVVSCCSRWR